MLNVYFMYNAYDGLVKKLPLNNDKLLFIMENIRELQRGGFLSCEHFHKLYVVNIYLFIIEVKFVLWDLVATKIYV